MHEKVKFSPGSAGLPLSGELDIVIILESVADWCLDYMKEAGQKPLFSAK